MSNDKFETITAKYWQKRWSQNEIGWQRDAVHKFLVKYVDELTDYRSNLRVFVPLCGKSLDMLWLADQGHHVVGVDFVKHPIESFFEENNLTFVSFLTLNWLLHVSKSMYTSARRNK